MGANAAREGSAQRASGSQQGSQSADAEGSGSQGVDSGREAGEGIANKGSVAGDDTQTAQGEEEVAGEKPTEPEPVAEPAATAPAAAPASNLVATVRSFLQPARPAAPGRLGVGNSKVRLLLCIRHACRGRYARTNSRLVM